MYIWRVFYPISFQVKVTMSACGQDYTLVLGEKGEIYSFGDNEYGQLGAGIEPGIDPPRAREDDVAICKVSTDIVAVKVVTGAYHSILINETGVVASWGRGDGGQLGHGDTLHLGRLIQPTVTPISQLYSDRLSSTNRILHFC